MKKKPFVSIVICTYNRSQFLRKYALSSISKLDYSNYEVVVVDDASTDNTKEVVMRFERKIKKLRYFRMKKNKMLCDVRNLGVKNCNGEIIAFTDDDCYVHKDWLKELVKPHMKDKKIVCIGGKYYLENSRKIINEKFFSGCNLSFKKNIFAKFLFDNFLYFNKSTMHDENELIRRIARKGFKIGFADKALVKHFRSKTGPRTSRELGAPLNEIYSLAKEISSIKYYYYFLKYIVFIYKKEFKELNRYEENPVCLIERAFQSLRRFISKSLFIEKKTETLFKIPYIFYALLFEIPIKAKIKNFIEEKRFMKN